MIKVYGNNMRLLVIADIHGNLEKLKEVLEKTRKEAFDVVICPGDFTDMYTIPTEFSQLDVGTLILQKILTLKKPTLCVPGNHDPYEILDVFNDYNVNLHSKIKKIKNTTFVGWGGAPTPFDTIFEPSDEETKENLTKLGKKLTPQNFVLVVHEPPKNTKLDIIRSGKHVGSPVIKEFIIEKQPTITITAHIHESPGLDNINKSPVFYPGPVFEGCYGIVEIKGKKTTCETKKI